MPEAYCGLDLGTSSAKAVLISPDGTALGRGKRRMGGQDGQPERDPQAWYQAAILACREALAAAPAKTRVLALAISGNGPSLVRLDRRGKPLGPAMLWCDKAPPEAADRVARAAGRPVDPSFYLPKALASFSADTGGFASGPEYLAELFGAQRVSYLSHPFFESFIWDVQSAASLGLNHELFPRYAAPCAVIGQLSGQAATDTGFPAGTPIVSAFPDFLAALVGSGTMETGLACDRTGSSEALNLCAAKPSPDTALFSLPHPAAGLWNVSGGLSTSGRALEWYQRTCMPGAQSTHAVIDQAMLSEPGAKRVAFIPYLEGERSPLRAPSLRGAFLGLGSSTGPKDMARAVAESIAYALCLVRERMEASGMGPRMVRCTGAMAQSAWLCQLKADALGLCLEVPEVAEAEAMGDACACSVALGHRASLSEASAVMVRVGARYEPSAGAAAAYGEAFRFWKRALNAALAIIDEGKQA